MAWIIGIDEAGYGPNLGPFVMSAVACRLPDFPFAAPDDAPPDLWQGLAAAVRKGKGRDDGRIVIDDSKVVHSGTRGLARLERGVLAALAPGPVATLAGFVGRLAPSCADELAGEAWYTGASPVPLHDAPPADLLARFRAACEQARVGPWEAFSVLVCAPRFNHLCDSAGSKAAVPAFALARLLEDALDRVAGADPVHVYVDKQGGRNSYTAQIQQGLPRGLVVPLAEGADRSVYRVAGLGRQVRLTFEPRAEDRHLPVALASMASKYLRERCMGEFNAFFVSHQPDLKPTAGYPVDAGRYLEQIRPTLAALALPLERVWRTR